MLFVPRPSGLGGGSPRAEVAEGCKRGEWPRVGSPGKFRAREPPLPLAPVPALPAPIPAPLLSSLSSQMSGVLVIAAWCFLQVESRHPEIITGNSNHGNFLDNDKWLSTVSQYDKDKYWNKFRDVSTSPF